MYQVLDKSTINLEMIPYLPVAKIEFLFICVKFQKIHVHLHLIKSNIMYTTYHLTSAQEVSIDILNSIKTNF